MRDRATSDSVIRSKGLRAGSEARATLGHVPPNIPTATRLRLIRSRPRA